jgi:hypothetical protein
MLLGVAGGMTAGALAGTLATTAPAYRVRHARRRADWRRRQMAAKYR